MNIGLLHYVNKDFKPMYYLPKVNKNLILDVYYIEDGKEIITNMGSFNRTLDNYKKEFGWYRSYLVDLKTLDSLSYA